MSAEILKVNTEALKDAARARGMTPQKYIERLARICHGSEVCAHRAFSKDGQTTFILSGSVRTF
jgi:hypothetical protein